MIKMNYVKIPKLRFHEFSGEWHVTKLGDLLKIGSGRDYKHLSNGNIPVYGTGGLMLYVNDYLYDGKSICIGRKGTINKPQFLNGKFWTVDTLFYTHDYKNSLPEFLYLIFQKINWLQHNEASGVPSLSKTTIEKIKVTIPDIQEQKKIAEFMTAVDDKLNILQQKVNLFKKYKKETARALFTQTLRFKDNNGNDFPDWQDKKLGSTCLIKKGSQINNDELLKSGKYPMLNGGISPSGYLNKYNTESGTVTISEGGNSCGYVNFMKQKLWAGGHLYTLEKPTIINELLYQILKFEQTRIMQLRVGSGLPNIQKSDLSKLIIRIPTLYEQMKIADLLTSLDDKINLEECKLEKAKRFQQSLLEKMLI